MRVLLIKDVDKLGKRGQEVSVKNGYARNYLMLKGFAVEVTEGHRKELEMTTKREEKLKEVKRQEMGELVKKVEGMSVSIEMRAGEDGKLFGGVGPVEIARALKEEGIEVEEKAIRMDEHIRELGVFLVEVHLAPGVSANVRVWIRG